MQLEYFISGTPKRETILFAHGAGANASQCESDRDINKTLKTTLEAISKNKKAGVVQFKGAGHIANLDKPDDFNQVLLKIITESDECKIF